MGKKEYVLDHDFDATAAAEMVKPWLQKAVEKYGLTLKEMSATEFNISMAGVNADLRLEDKKAYATVELSFLLEKMVRPKMEKILEEKVKPKFQKMDA